MAESSSNEIGLNWLNIETWARQETQVLQEGNILDIMSVISGQQRMKKHFSHNLKDRYQGVAEFTILSIVLNQALGFFLLPSTGKINSITLLSN